MTLAISAVAELIAETEVTVS